MKATTLIVAVVTAALIPGSAYAGPSPEIAKRCMHYSYVVYPYKRPGSVRGSGDRQSDAGGGFAAPDGAGEGGAHRVPASTD